jgi:hypothetical protein
MAHSPEETHRMSDKRRRSWFQIHLSTAIMLMLVAGGLVWANAEPTKFYSMGDELVFFRGWPYTFQGNINGDVIKDYFWPEYMARNVASAVMILGTVAFACEWWIRRRSARAPHSC